MTAAAVNWRRAQLVDRFPICDRDALEALTRVYMLLLKKLANDLPYEITGFETAQLHSSRLHRRFQSAHVTYMISYS